MTSKIKVDNIENQCGGAVVTKCGATTTISGSVVKADDIQAADGGNLINQCGTTITLGASGDTINLASGASQSGFGREGSVDWQTGSIKTATFTAANGEGYFANTSGGAFTMNLPAGTAGNIVSVVDYTNTFQTNNLTIAPNGSQKIGGVAASIALSTEGQSLTFVYVDDTEGWKNVQDSTSNAIGAVDYISATGGTETECGDFKIHTFTGPGTFTVSAVSNVCAARNTVGYLVVAGGGGGGANRGGGGGGGGFREGRNVPIDNFTASPKVADAPTNAVTVTGQAYPITVGAGGNGAAYPEIAPSGSVSTFDSITSAGGGGGGGAFTSCGNGGSGGSGGGGAGYDTTSSAGAAGNVPSVSPPQGNGGGNGAPQQPGGSGGGGGGATASGSNASGSSGGNGGAGATTSINGSPVGRAGGGGGGPWNSGTTSASDGGGGGVQTTPNTAANPGTANTGGGGGAGYWGGGGNGGSGLVIIRYKFQ